MAPTQDEELQLRLYNCDINQLRPSERFLKNMVEIPHAFKRLEALQFLSSVHEDYNMDKESFATLEVLHSIFVAFRLYSYAFRSCFRHLYLSVLLKLAIC